MANIVNRQQQRLKNNVANAHKPAITLGIARIITRSAEAQAAADRQTGMAIGAGLASIGVGIQRDRERKADRRERNDAREDSQLHALELAEKRDALAKTRALDPDIRAAKESAAKTQAELETGQRILLFDHEWDKKHAGESAAAASDAAQVARMMEAIGDPNAGQAQGAAANLADDAKAKEGALSASQRRMREVYGAEPSDEQKHKYWTDPSTGFWLSKRQALVGSSISELQTIIQKTPKNEEEVRVQDRAEILLANKKSEMAQIQFSMSMVGHHMDLDKEGRAQDQRLEAARVGAGLRAGAVDLKDRKRTEERRLIYESQLSQGVDLLHKAGGIAPGQENEVIERLQRVTGPWGNPLKHAQELIDMGQDAMNKALAGDIAKRKELSDLKKLIVDTGNDYDLTSPSNEQLNEMLFSGFLTHLGKGKNSRKGQTDPVIEEIRARGMQGVVAAQFDAAVKHNMKQLEERDQGRGKAMTDKELLKAEDRIRAELSRQTGIPQKDWLAWDKAESTGAGAKPATGMREYDAGKEDLRVENREAQDRGFFAHGKGMSRSDAAREMKRARKFGIYRAKEWEEMKEEAGGDSAKQLADWVNANSNDHFTLMRLSGNPKHSKK